MQSTEQQKSKNGVENVSKMCNFIFLDWVIGKLAIASVFDLGHKLCSLYELNSDIKEGWLIALNKQTNKCHLKQEMTSCDGNDCDTRRISRLNN